MELSDYCTSVQSFVAMDLEKSWVRFSAVDLKGYRGNYRVLAPEISERPGAFLRLILKIACFFAQIFGVSLHLKQAGDFRKFALDYARLSRIEPVNCSLNESVETQVTAVLDKLKKGCNAAKGDAIQSLKKAVASDFASLDKAKQYEKAVSVLRVDKKSLSPCIEIDWRSMNEFFDTTYVRSLTAAHPDLALCKDKKDFLKLRDQLYPKLGTYWILRDVYGNIFNFDQSRKIYKAVALIFNQIKKTENEPNFQARLAALVETIQESFQNCSNRILSDLNRLSYQFYSPDCKGVERQVKSFCQELRSQILGAAISFQIECSNDPIYYKQHEASSVAYFTRTMSEEFGLPEPLCSSDLRFEGYAAKSWDAQNHIRKYFHDRYTPAYICQRVWEALHDVNDPAIHTQAFTDWALAKYEAESLCEKLNEDGTYKIELVVEFLIEIGILTI